MSKLGEAATLDAVAGAGRCSVDSVRWLALSLPEATVMDHHGLDSFRICGKIFATVPDEHHVRIMVDEEGVRTAVAIYPGVCEPFFWGKRLACVVVNLESATQDLVAELLHEAWLRKAPKRLTA